MKTTAFLVLILLSFISCKTKEFGFKYNPARILHDAYVAADEADLDAFRTMIRREAFCQYGTQEGFQYLHENLYNNKLKVTSEFQLVGEEYFQDPRYVDFWSYYSKTYIGYIKEKNSQTELIKVLFKCHFGKAGEKDLTLKNLPMNKYEEKRCWIYKLESSTFINPPSIKGCQGLTIDWPRSKPL